MHKTEFINRINKRVSGSAGDAITKSDVEKVLDASLDAITAALEEGEEVRLTGFGTFKTSKRNPTNPQTGEKLGERNVPVFKPGSSLKESVR